MIQNEELILKIKKMVFYQLGLGLIVGITIPMIVH